MADCATGILIDFNEEEKKVPVRAQPEVALPPLPLDVPQLTEEVPEIVCKEKNVGTVEDLLNEDVKLIDSEEFNFDLLMSPCSEGQQPEEEEDADEEVFFGPVQGFSEICAAASVVAKETETKDEIKPMSPLNPKQVAELFKEAHTLAFHIENSKTDSPDATVDGLARKFRRARISHQIRSEKVSPPVKSPSADSGLADTSASSQDERSESDPPKFSLDFKTPEKIVTLGSSVVETRIEKIKLPESELPKTSSGAPRFQGRGGLDGLKCSKVSKTGTSVPASKQAKPGLQKPSRLVRGGSFRQKPVTSPMKRQRKNSLGSDVETASIGSDKSDSATSLTGLPLTGGKRALAPPRQRSQPSLKLPQNRQRTLSNSSAGSNCSTSSQVSNCSQTSAPPVMTSLTRGLPKTKMQLKPNLGLKVPAKSQEKRPTGPVKAKPPSPNKKTKKPTPPKPIQKENKPAMKPPDGRAPRRPLTSTGSSGGSVGNTPTPHKPEKNLQPKRLLTAAPSTPKRETAGGQPSTPQSAVTGSATKRRSLLPTPASARSAAAKPSPLSSRLANQGSRNTDASPVFAKKTAAKSLKTPDVTKPRPRVVHTPLLAKPATPQPASRWSPVKKNRPIFKEDEYYQCTKRGAKQ